MIGTILFRTLINAGIPIGSLFYFDKWDSQTVIILYFIAFIAMASFFSYRDGEASNR